MLVFLLGFTSGLAIGLLLGYLLVRRKVVESSPTRVVQDHDVCKECGLLVARYRNNEDGSITCLNCVSEGK